LKKVLIITYYWPPAGGAGVQRWVKLSKYLAASGVDTYVLSVNPEQASYPVRDPSLLKEVGAGVKVSHCETREWFAAYSKVSGTKKIPMAGFAGEEKPSLMQLAARFVRGNFFVPDPRKGWNKYAISKALELIREHGITTIITTGPPHSTQLIGLSLKAKTKLYWIADFRDPWTDIYYYKNFMHLPPAAALDKAYERRVLEHADRIIVISHDMKRLFAGKSPRLKDTPIQVLPNGYDEADFIHQAIPAQKKVLKMVYTGTLTEIYPLEAILPAVRACADIFPFEITFTGSVSHPALAELGAMLGEQFRIRAHVPHQDPIASAMSASCLLFLIPPTEAYKVLPGKLFEYVRSGPPILGIGPADGDAASILRQTGAGEMFDPQNVEEIKKYLIAIFQGYTPVRDAQAISSYSRKAQADELLTWIV